MIFGLFPYFSVNFAISKCPMFLLLCDPYDSTSHPEYTRNFSWKSIEEKSMLSPYSCCKCVCGTCHIHVMQRYLVEDKFTDQINAMVVLTLSNTCETISPMSTHDDKLQISDEGTIFVKVNAP